MKRIHLSIAARDVAASTRFYTDFFGRAPDFARDDYARWLLDDPAVNFSVKHSSREQGVSHVGIEAATADELAALRAQYRDAGLSGIEQGDTTCCYARSDKSWHRDPDGVAWESFMTRERLADEPPAGAPGGCCAADRQDGVACCA